MKRALVVMVGGGGTPPDWCRRRRPTQTSPVRARTPRGGMTPGSWEVRTATCWRSRALRARSTSSRCLRTWPTSAAASPGVRSWRTPTATACRSRRRPPLTAWAPGLGIPAPDPGDKSGVAEPRPQPRLPSWERRSAGKGLDPDARRSGRLPDRGRRCPVRRWGCDVGRRVVVNEPARPSPAAEAMFAGHAITGLVPSNPVHRRLRRSPRFAADSTTRSPVADVGRDGTPISRRGRRRRLPPIDAFGAVRHGRSGGDGGSGVGGGAARGCLDDADDGPAERDEAVPVDLVDRVGCVEQVPGRRGTARSARRGGAGGRRRSVGSRRARRGRRAAIGAGRWPRSRRSPSPPARGRGS